MCFKYTMGGFKNFCPEIVCFFTVKNFYQDLLSRYVLGHAIKMFLLCKWYQPSAIFTWAAGAAKFSKIFVKIFLFIYLFFFKFCNTLIAQMVARQQWWRL